MTHSHGMEPIFISCAVEQYVNSCEQCQYVVLSARLCMNQPINAT
jgi:hypothetical protein